MHLHCFQSFLTAHSHEEEKTTSTSSSPWTHQLYADMKEANSVWCELVGLKPQEVNHVHIRLNLENRAELFDRVLLQVELYLVRVRCG